MPKTLIHLSGSLLDRSALREQTRALELNYQHLQKSAKNFTEVLNDLSNIFAIDLGYMGLESLEALGKFPEIKNRSITYSSHVDREIMTKAEQLGFRVLPRSKFFTSIAEIITGLRGAAD